MSAKWEALLADPPPKNLAALGIPLRYARARLSDFPGLCGEHFPNDDGLYLSGSAGRGKTHMATAHMIAMLPQIAEWKPERLDPDISARWVTAPDLLARFRATFGDRARETEEDVHREYARVRLLLIDDLGSERATDWTAGAIYRLISARINGMLPTIITSNLSLTETQGSDPRLASRLGGMAYVRLEGPDRRLVP